MMLSVMPSVRYSIAGSAPAFDERQDRRATCRATRAACASGLDGRRSAEQRAQRHRRRRPPNRTASTARARCSARRSARARAARPRRIAESSGPRSCSSCATISCGVLPAKQRPAAQHLVEDAAEREDIRSARRRGRPSPAPATCSRTCRARRCGAVRASVGPSPSSAGSSSRRSASPKSRIFTAPSRVRNTFSGLRSRWTTPRACAAARPSAIDAAIVHRLAPRQRARLQPCAQRVSLEQLHHRDGHVVDDRQLVDRDDARVRQRGDRARLGLEPPPHLGIGRDVRRHHLDGDVAIEPRVARAIHLAHAAGADGFEDLVLREARAVESVVTF